MQYHPVIPTVYVNTYRLYILYTTKNKPLSYLQFRTELYYTLVQYSTTVEQRQLQMVSLGQHTFGPDLLCLYYWVQRSVRSTCR
jgi:hypothetical protein